ncbi:MAG TPA: ABC transporter permease [Candidatus Eremiobacteraceae bacterium]|nr:ABC transporter permease [Candidatus Eremiobacteraceae bacterium]
MHAFAQTWAFALTHQGSIESAIREHLALSASALGSAAVVCLPLGVLASRYGWGRAVIAAVNGVRVIPSLAILALVLPWLGLGFASALVALVVLACPPVLVNTDVAFRGVDAGAVESARAMGMTSSQVLWRVQTPLALPVVLAGLRVAAVEVVASATLATLIGAGGLGDLIVAGLELNEPAELLVGSLSAAALALAAAAAFSLWERLAAARR